MDTTDGPGPVGIIGLGYVGCCLAAVLAERDFRVYGVDIYDDVVRTVDSGRCPIEEERISDEFVRGTERGQITASSEFTTLEACQTVLVTVGTPLATSEPDLSAVEAATETLGQHLQAGQTVIYRSTLPARTTEDVIRPTLEAESGLEAGRDFWLAFCPERMAEGSAYEDLRSTPVVIGGYSSDCTKRVAMFWDAVDLETTTVSDPTSAELTKLADNWWIDLNIALANEVALLSEQLDADALEVIEAANTLEKGDGAVNILYPGAGVGGSCLVKDPWFVANLGAKHGLELETPQVSRRVNERMPEHVVSLVRETLSGLSGERVAVLGYAFKGGTDDTRNTPAKPIIDGLSESNSEVRVTDPYVSDSTIREETGFEPVTLSSALTDASAVVVVTGHDSFRGLDPAALIKEVGHEEFSIVDGRHVFDPDAFAETNVTYVGIGRGRDE